MAILGRRIEGWRRKGCDLRFAIAFDPEPGCPQSHPTSHIMTSDAREPSDMDEKARQSAFVSALTNEHFVLHNAVVTQRAEIGHEGSLR